MTLSDCAKCWETPCRCPDGEIGQLKARIKALEAACRLSLLALVDYDLNGEICGDYFGGAYAALESAGYGEGA